MILLGMNVDLADILMAGKQSDKGVNTGAPEAKEGEEGGSHCWGVLKQCSLMTGFPDSLLSGSIHFAINSIVTVLSGATISISHPSCIGSTPLAAYLLITDKCPRARMARKIKVYLLLWGCSCCPEKEATLPHSRVLSVNPHSML